MPIGWVGEDVVDAVGDGLSAAGDAFSDVVKVVPLGPELSGALKDLINGPLRDFARTPAGMVVFRAMSSTLYGSLAWTLGPQLAAIAFAVPGLARGEDFWHAWFTEVQWRAQKTAEILAPQAADLLGQQLKDAAAQLAQMLPEEVRETALSELASRLHTQEWIVAMAEAVTWPDLFPMPGRYDFDLSTGKRKPRVAVGKRAGVASSTPRDICVQANEAEAMGLPVMIVLSLQHKCDAASAAIAAGGGGSVASSAPETSSTSSPATRVLLGVLAGCAVVGAAWYFTRD